MYLVFLALVTIQAMQYSYRCYDKPQMFTIRELPNIEFCQDAYQAPIDQDAQSQERRTTLKKEIQQFGNPFSWSARNMSMYVNLNELHNTGTLKEQHQTTSETRQMIKISKDIYMTNIFTSNLLITNMYSSSNILRLAFDSFEIAPGETVRAFRAHLEQKMADIHHATYEIYFAIEIRYAVKIPMKLLIYNKQLQYKSQESFGNINLYTQSRKTISIHNPNPIQIEVTYFQLDNKQNRMRALLADRHLLKSIIRKKMIKKQYHFEIQPFSSVELLLIINADQIENGRRALNLNTDYEQIQIAVNFRVVQGSHMSLSALQLNLFSQYQRNQLLKNEYMHKQQTQMLANLKVPKELFLDSLIYADLIAANASLFNTAPLKNNHRVQKVTFDYQYLMQICVVFLNLLFMIQKLHELILNKSPKQANTQFVIQIAQTSSFQDEDYSYEEISAFQETQQLTTKEEEEPVQQQFQYQQQQPEQVQSQEQNEIIVKQLINVPELQQESESESGSGSESESNENDYESEDGNHESEDQNEEYTDQNGSSHYTEQDLANVPMTEQLITNNDDASSSKFSQGESISDQEELTQEINVQPQVPKQTRQFDLFHKVSFSVPYKEQQRQSLQNSQFYKDSYIFYYPNNDSDQEQEFELGINNKYQNMNFQQSDLQYPFKHNRPPGML